MGQNLRVALGSALKVISMKDASSVPNLDDHHNDTGSATLDAAGAGTRRNWRP